MPEFASEDRSNGSTRTVSTGRVQLRFEWITDRWYHQISVRSAGDWIPVACSHEALEIDHQPAELTCPAYQQFHYQEAEGRAIALLVGQSGPHHVSASFEVEESAARTRIMVDVADRVRAREPSLACTYLAREHTSAPIIDGPSRIAWDIAGSGRLTLSSGAPSDRPWRVDSRIIVNADQAPLTLVKIVEDPDPDASSLRCRYHWTFESLDERGSQTL